MLQDDGCKSFEIILYCLYIMNGNIIKEDSLLSNISNISVKIGHNHHDGSGFFNNFVQSHDNEVQVPLDALDDHVYLNHESLLGKVMEKQKNHDHVHEHENTWVVGNNVHGLSENEDESSSSSQSYMPLQCPASPNQQVQQQVVETDEMRRQKLLIEKRLKNETKNIPKNYGKAIISFIEKYQDKVKYITRKNNVDYEDFVEELKEKKKVINTIADLRSMWVDYKYAKCIRLLSNLFLRKYALNYIFNSRICNYSSHIKYRYRLCEAIKEPYQFKHIKDY